MRRGMLRSIAGAIVLVLAAGQAVAKKKAISAEPPPGALIDEISFADSPPGRVYVDLAPDGNSRPFRLMLDTGAQASVFTPGAARAQGVSVRRTRDRPYRKKTRLGKDLLFYVDTSASDTGSPVGWEYALFGGDQLYPFVFEIDFPAKVVRFYDSKKYRLPKELDAPGEALLRMRVTANRPFVEVEIEGKKTWMLVDTGAPMGLTISGSTAKKLGIDVASLPDLLRVGTTVSPVSLRLYEASEVALGPFKIADAPVLVAPTGFFNIAGNTDSILGMDILERFIVRFDYKSGRMWLKPHVHGAATFLGVDYSVTRESGVFMAIAGIGPLAEYEVIGVLPGSAAARLGVQRGDRIAPRRTAHPRDALLAIIQTIMEGRALTVVRFEGDIGVDTMLGPLSPSEVGAGPEE